MLPFWQIGVFISLFIGPVIFIWFLNEFVFDEMAQDIKNWFKKRKENI